MDPISQVALTDVPGISESLNKYMYFTQGV